MSLYADTSFLFSLYLPDAHSDEATRILQHADVPIWLTPLSELELTNAFQLRRYRHEMSTADIRGAEKAFRSDINHGIYILKSLSASIWERADRLVRRRTFRTGVRTLDILHVASALEFHAKEMLTFDKKLAA